MKRLTALVLALALLLGLAACKKEEEGPSQAANPSAAPSSSAPSQGQESPSPSAAASREEPELLPDNAIDVCQELLGFPNTTALFTVNGGAVTAETYLYWLGNMTSYYQQLAGQYGESIDFQEVIVDGETWDQRLRAMAFENSTLLTLLPQLAAQEGVSLTDEDYASIAATRRDNIDSAGGEEQYAYHLQAMGISDRSACELDKASALLTRLGEVWEARAMAGYTQADAEEYALEGDLLRAKHILLLTMDMSTYTPYDDEAKAAQKAKAEGLLSQLRAADDPVALFDQLMAENTEDPGSAAYPDGYLFTAGEMVSAFEEGTRALGFNQISELVESEYGYHIILRLEPDCQELREKMAADGFNAYLQEQVEAAQVETTEEYDALTTQDYYEKLVQFQESLTAPGDGDQK